MANLVVPPKTGEVARASARTKVRMLGNDATRIQTFLLIGLLGLAAMVGFVLGVTRPWAMERGFEMNLTLGLVGVAVGQGVLSFVVISARAGLDRVEQERIVGRRILRLRSSGEETTW